MLADIAIARFFCFAGGGLFLLGLILWALLPVHFSMPPYFFTPLLALAYGGWSWRKSRDASRRNGVRE